MGKYDDLDLGWGGILLGAATIAGLFGLSVRNARASAEAETRRRAVPIQWTEGLSLEIFSKFCIESAKTIRRLKVVSIEGLSITCEVRSSSGISTWRFSADFCDYGKLSGRYYINYTENIDSQIPEIFLQKVSDKIKGITYSYNVFTPKSYEDMIGMNVESVKNLFLNSGFLNVTTIPKEKSLFKFFKRTGNVYDIEIDGQYSFENSQCFRSGSMVKIFYYGK
ncbi:hypothetical protein [Streptococcus oricebi]|uniref:Uncharacterized protein n=1 Tax=Streptococcus oricebi TaxID=1547447 RepID=A0ABS5B3F2_9STRE|nr:hypothetical protein [Streptococcus oricebi]MBP2623347.1 hypothetical protein [Streptococcus oricebi]